MRAERRRDLPLEAMACYVIAAGLFRQVSIREVLHCLADGLRWAALGVPVRISGESLISRARSRLGTVPFEELRRARVSALALRAGSYRGDSEHAQATALLAHISRECWSWPTAAISGSPRGRRLRRPEPSCSGARRRTSACARRVSGSRTGRGLQTRRTPRRSLPTSDDAFRSRPVPDPRARRALPRAVGDRERLRRGQDPSAGTGAALRSKTPELVLQETDGLMLAHCAGRRLIHRATGKALRSTKSVQRLFSMQHLVAGKASAPAFDQRYPRHRKLGCTHPEEPRSLG